MPSSRLNNDKQRVLMKQCQELQQWQQNCKKISVEIKIQIKVLTECQRRIHQANLKTLDTSNPQAKTGKTQWVPSQDPIHQRWWDYQESSQYIPRCRPNWLPDCYPITNPATWKQIWLSEDGKWKKRYCTLHRALTSSCKDNWKEKVTALKNFEKGKQSDQHKKFKQLIQEFKREYLADDALKTKKNAIYDGDFTTMAMTIMKL